MDCYSVTTEEHAEQPVFSHESHDEFSEPLPFSLL